jgi:hypothetical protein
MSKTPIDFRTKEGLEKYHELFAEYKKAKANGNFETFRHDCMIKAVVSEKSLINWMDMNPLPDEYWLNPELWDEYKRMSEVQAAIGYFAKRAL